MDHDQITHENRQFLKAHLWRAWFNSQTDQKKGVPAPPKEKPLPPEAALIDLPDPLAGEIGQIPLAQAIRQRRSRREYSAAPLSLEELSFLLWATQGLGVDESGQPIQRGVSVLRNVPSGGARHSFETYLLLRKITGLESGLYRYLPLTHRLACLFTLAEIAPLLEGKEVARGWMGEAAAVFMWTTIPYRSEWRYSIVAARLIALDAGHVCQNLYLACEAVNAGMCAIGAYNQQEMDELLGVDGEEEFTIYVATVGKKS